MDVIARKCETCGKTLKGRSDKKFCDDFCRNNFNNRLKSTDNNYVRNVTNALRKNRRILQDCLPEDAELVKTTSEKLHHAGFNFKYHTHTYTNKKGNTYFFCYEFGYLPLEQDRFLIVKRQDEI
jgi:transcriptional accessory protein Tex/SPT6